MTVCAQAVLFDMDGLLVDTEPIWYDVESTLVRSLGGSWSPQDQAACIGGTLDATCRYILDRTGVARSVESLQDELLAAMVTRCRRDLPLHAGALELVDAVRSRAVPTALVSSSYRALMDAVLAGLGTHRFDVTVAGDEVAAGKPAPDPYLTACARLGVPPARTVALEDALTGVLSAESAGCRVVAVPSVAPIPDAPRRAVRARLVEVDVDWLLGLPCS